MGGVIIKEFVSSSSSIVDAFLGRSIFGISLLKMGCYIAPLGHYTILVIKNSL